jgi:hypothetical protein
LRNVNVFENVRRTVLFENDGFHQVPVLRAKWESPRMSLHKVTYVDMRRGAP